MSDSVLIFAETDEGLELVAEVEDTDNAPMALDALLDQLEDEDPLEEYIAIIGSLDDGVVCRLTVEDAEPVRPRRGIAISIATDSDDEAPASVPKKRGPGSPRKVTEDEVEVAPVKRRGRPPGSKNKPGAKKPGPKAGAKRGPGRPAGSKNKPKGSAFKKNSDSED